MITYKLENGDIHVTIKKGTETYITICKPSKVSAFLRWVMA